MKNVLKIEVKFAISLWDCIKLRIAGRNADALCRMIFDRAKESVDMVVDQEQKEHK